MAAPGYHLSMHFILGFSQSPAVADLSRESACGSHGPLVDMVVHRWLPDAMINLDTTIDIEIKKGTQKDDTADRR